MAIIKYTLVNGQTPSGITDRGYWQHPTDETFIGIGSNLFNHVFTDTYVPPFSWGKDKKVQFENFITTLSKMKKRREKTISPSEKKIIEEIYSQ